MRNIGADGNATHLAEVGEPWVTAWRSDGHCRVIFGHDARRRLQQGPNYLGLDTGLVYGNKLTALLRYPSGEEQLITADAKSVYEKVKGPLLP